MESAYWSSEEGAHVEEARPPQPDGYAKVPVQFPGGQDTASPLVHSPTSGGQKSWVSMSRGSHLLLSALLLAAGISLAVALQIRRSGASNQLVPGHELGAMTLLTALNPPGWVEDLVRQAGNRNATARGNGFSSSEHRLILERVFNGTHVRGHPAGEAHGQFWIYMHLHAHSAKGSAREIGPVELSANAKLFRAALQQQGFQHQTFYHGTRNLFVTSILSGGFLFEKTAWLGPGIYVCGTFEHAQCYSSGSGGPVLELEVYWKPENKTRYIKHPPHTSLANDVYVVTDPLLVFPVEVHECCPKELTCM